MSAPVHVWRPPYLASTVGKQVVVSDVVGPERITGLIKEKLITMAPSDAGRAFVIVDAESFQEKTQIRLVSASDDEINDLAIASVARREGADFLLRGEVIEDRNGVKDGDAPRTLKVSWRLQSLDGQETVEGMPIVVDLDSAIERYPDLAVMSDVESALASAVVRDTYRLMAPSVRRDRVDLEIAYLLPGSAEHRRGVAAALAGRWADAEAIWEEVYREHPTQVAAIHNLAVAAAAGQDFSRAKDLARKAIRLQPTPLHKQTLAWIELNQRDYHQSFGLPDPPEGWFLTKDE